MNLIERDVAQFSSDKIINHEHLARVSKWTEGENVAPITVEIDMTDRCFHHCLDCPGGRTGGELENPEKIIDQLAKLGCKGIVFTGGGEPLIHKRTPEMISYAKQKGLDVALITNGSIMTNKIAKAVGSNCVWVRVSLDASNPKEYQYSHGLSARAFRKVVSNIRLLAKFKGSCTLGVGYLMDGQSLAGMEEATKLCKGLGVDYIQFRPRHGDQTMIDDQLNQCLKHERNGFRVLWSKHKYESMRRGDFGRNYDKCYGQQFATVVSANGKMYVCCHMRGMEKYAIGDTNAQTIKEIWESEHRQAVVEAIDFNDCPPLCRDNTFNQILWEIKKDKEHSSFL